MFSMLCLRYVHVGFTSRMGAYSVSALVASNSLLDYYMNRRESLGFFCLGKNLDDFRLRKLAKEIKLRRSQLIKLKFIQL